VHECDTGNKGFCGMIYQNNVAGKAGSSMIHQRVINNCQDWINGSKGRVATPAGM
jgi:hypothetical protein